MNGLDFKRASDLFLGSEAELSLALGLDRSDLKRYRENPSNVPVETMARLGRVLIERGRGMVRVGEMISGA